MLDEVFENEIIDSFCTISKCNSCFPKLVMK